LTHAVYLLPTLYVYSLLAFKSIPYCRRTGDCKIAGKITKKFRRKYIEEYIIET